MCAINDAPSPYSLSPHIVATSELWSHSKADVVICHLPFVPLNSSINLFFSILVLL